MRLRDGLAMCAMMALTGFGYSGEPVEGAPQKSKGRPPVEAVQVPAGRRGLYVSPAGNDSAAGTIDAPWKTVSHAVASAAPGDVISLRAGSYRGAIFVDKPDLTIQSHAGERATLTAPADANNLWFGAVGGKALNLDLRGGLYGVKFEQGGGTGRRLQGHRDRLLRHQGRPRGRPRHHLPDRDRQHGPRPARRRHR